MFSSRLLLLFVCCAVGLADNYFENHPDVVKCNSKCSKTHEVACQKGCLFAYALTFAPNNDKHTPSCTESCNDAFTQVDDQAECIKGCGAFVSSATAVAPNNRKKMFFVPLTDFAHRISNFFRQRLGGLFGNPETSAIAHGETNDAATNNDMGETLHVRTIVRSSISEQEGIESNQDEPVVSARVRIIMLSEPHDENANVDDLQRSVELLAARAGGSDDQTQESVQSMVGRSRVVCMKFMNSIREVFKNPFNLLLALSLLALLLLLIAQITLCVLRKPRPQSYNQYAHLPSYAEAVEVKIPFSVEEYGFKGVEKLGPTSDNSQA